MRTVSTTAPTTAAQRAAAPTTAAPTTAAPMTAAQRAAFERDGYLVVPGVLDPAELADHTALVDRLYRERAPGGGALHRLSAVASVPGLAPLVDHPRVFGLVWSLLGWNIHVYHSHVDVHPPIAAPRPFRFEWHQDGGRQNRELETDPRPRMSVKVAYWLSDVSGPGRGNFRVVPGSHTTNWIDGPPRRDMAWPDPAGAIEVTAHAGDAVLFDRRLWHARSDNHSAVTRKAVFFGYTYRWVRTRDRIPRDEPGLSPVQRQLLGLLGAPDGGVDGDHAWGHEPGSVPLYEALRAAGRLDPAHPPLRP